jgi:hypothetical protein
MRKREEEGEKRETKKKTMICKNKKTLKKRPSNARPSVHPLAMGYFLHDVVRLFHPRPSIPFHSAPFPGMIETRFPPSLPLQPIALMLLIPLLPDGPPFPRSLPGINTFF